MAASHLAFKIDIEYLFPLIDLWMSIVVRKISGCHQIDLAAYAEQSEIYLKHTSDYSKLIGDTGPIQYPALSLYIYSFFNLVTGYNITKEFMSDVHIVIDMVRMWLLVKIYKTAIRDTRFNKNMFMMALLFLQAKYKFVGVTRQFNDCFMMLFCLLAIRAWQHRHLMLSTFLFAIAINIKMSSLLLIPGYLLTVAFDCGILKSLMSLVAMAALQVAFGLEFLLVNPGAYFAMSYNFDRVFLKVEQVNFQFLDEEFIHSPAFNKFLLFSHLFFLLTFLFFKWTSGLAEFQ